MRGMVDERRRCRRPLPRPSRRSIRDVPDERQDASRHAQAVRRGLANLGERNVRKCPCRWSDHFGHLIGRQYREGCCYQSAPVQAEAALTFLLASVSRDVAWLSQDSLSRVERAPGRKPLIFRRDKVKYMRRWAMGSGGAAGQSDFLACWFGLCRSDIDDIESTIAGAW